MNFDIDPRELDLQGADGMQLVRLLRRLIAEEGGGGGDEPVPSDVSDFFYCTYDVTTYSEIHNALTQNKIPVCPLDGHYYYLVSTTQSRYTFACYNNVNHSIMCVRCASSGWDSVTFLPQEKLTWDYTPTQGSTNPVTSGGVYTAIKNNSVDPEDIQEAVDAWLDEHSSTVGGLSYEAKQALMDCFENVAWINDDGQEYYDALYDALFGTTPITPTLDYILAVFNQGSAVIYDDASLDSLRQYLTVTAYYTDETSQVITNYQLAGTLTAGQSVITASYQGQFTTFTVNVTARATLASISAVFTQGSAIIYETDSLDTLRQYLVVTANYSDSTTATVTNYTLSGTLSSATSTITVSYGGKTTTFNVSVTMWDYKWDASSGVAPLDKDGNSALGSFENGLFKLGYSFGNWFLFANPGPVEWEIEYDITSVAPATYNIPNFSVCTDFSNNAGTGAKLYRNSSENIATVGLGTTASENPITYPMGTNQHIKAKGTANNYEIALNNNVYQGSGTTTQYTYGTGIQYSAEKASTNEHQDLYLRYIRFRYLGV